MKIRKLFSVLLIALLALSSVAALAAEIPAPEGDDNVIAIGATEVPHAQIIDNVVKPALEAAGWKVDLQVFNDYVIPNTSLEDGELDANYFQHLLYMQSENENRGLHLYPAKGVHLEPLGLFSEKIKSIDELADGASISLPNDASNESRALKLLADNGLITLAEKDGLYELSDITDNPHNYDLVELEAANTPNSLPDVDAAIINGNYALQRELNPATDALVLESSDPNGNVFINYLVVREDNKDSLKTQALVAAFSTQDVVDYIEANYSGSVIPAADLVE
ncbi:MAG: methionine ABC transporter substrate-binding protein [Clostridia bacterium]|nr:methionine ABC transporter substrate-binding protein [Clostridia bacterium]MBR6889372.1 methionine ABC transporter substrate-binding protein [Clostridia bacterium]